MICKMTKNQIEKFAVGYPFPTDWVETVLECCDFDTDKANMILQIRNRTEEIIQRKEVESTSMTCGITDCCGYDFGEEAFKKKIKVRFCPVCGKIIRTIN